MEKLAYLLKRRAPRLFEFVERTARTIACLLYGSRLSDALKQANISGPFDGRVALIRPLEECDSDALHGFLSCLPVEHLRYFQPHSFDAAGLRSVLRSCALLTYGIFVDQQLIAYCLLKIAPTGSAYIGLLVHPGYEGRGVGKFIVAYLYWQSSLAKLRTRSTISRHNKGSLRSHRAVAEYRVVADLPNDYIMIEFPLVAADKPELKIL